MLDQMVKAVPGLSVTQQSEWLHTMGIDELVSEGNKYWDEHKSSPDIYAMKMRSRVNEAQALTSQEGLGAFSVLELDL
jgi:SAM-dependent MidA family methyltransferase